MEGQHKPIKRSAELAPLSRDHHQGLLLGYKLRQGIKYGVEAHRMTAFVKWFWAAHLVPHFEKEEKYLPVVLSDQHPLIQQMLSEHEVIKSKIEQLTDTSSTSAFEDLDATITQHIRFEERVLFDEVEKCATAEQLQWLAEGLTDDPVSETWEDNFWVAKK